MNIIYFFKTQSFGCVFLCRRGRGYELKTSRESKSQARFELSGFNYKSRKRAPHKFINKNKI